MKKLTHIIEGKNFIMKLWMDNGKYQNFQLSKVDILKKLPQNLVTSKTNSGRHDKYRKSIDVFNIILMWKDNSIYKYSEPFSS